MTPPIRPTPQNDIGPIYKVLGFGALFLALGIVVIQVLRGERIGLHDVFFVLVATLLCLALIRPDGFDNFIKTIADKLPMFSYRKPD
jgi:hypothetical protein